MSDLKLGELSEALKKKYKYEVYEVELEIVKSLGKIAEPKTIQFLQYIVDSEDDTQLQIWMFFEWLAPLFALLGIGFTDGNGNER